ncbi:trypsin-like peptidase domain-containing protein [Pelagerythrobacter sp.]|uniref:S1 family peptidase n=1 Tax=Pelagerythrobacter sp. TaxID=2800702 RepID=UPI0035B0AAA7
MTRLLALLATLFALALPATAQADPADIDAAARGVVRVVIIGTDGQEIFPVSHGTGFAVAPNRIVTNAHVVREALQDDTLRIGIVPSEGGEAADYARTVAVSPGKDLALVEITGDLRLPPLTVAAGPVRDGEVSAVGYPMNVDRAQGLDIADIFRSQPPVKSRGFISGQRPSRLFDTILHTATIARGNSGGPLLDGCGRVIGVNSFGTDSGGSDGEFFFAVSTRELLPFLRANDVEARISSLPCRSLEDLNEAERARVEREQADARQQLAARAEETRERRARAEDEARESVQTDRENAMALAFVLALIAAGAGAVAWQARQAGESGEKRLMIAGTVCAAAVIAALALWFTRPGLDEIERRVAAAMDEASDAPDAPGADATGDGMLTCTLDLSRSRVVGAPDRQLEFSWREDGCVNGRTQYGFSGGSWSRVFVPDEEEAVSVNVFDPATGSFRTDRYLLGRGAMTGAREARGKYAPPQCGAPEAAGDLGELQSGVTGLLPDAPNERLVYACAEKVG